MFTIQQEIQANAQWELREPIVFKYISRLDKYTNSEVML